MRLTTLLCVPCILTIAGVVGAHYTQADRPDKNRSVYDAGAGWKRDTHKEAPATHADPFAPNELTASVLTPTPLTRLQRERAAYRWHQLHEQARRAQLENEMTTPIRRSSVYAKPRRSTDRHARVGATQRYSNKRDRRHRTMFERTNRYAKSSLYDRSGRHRGGKRPANPRYKGRDARGL